jgi:hypothetical protein
VAHNIPLAEEQRLCKIWNEQIRSCQKAKERYTLAAIDGEKYYAGPNHDFLYSGKNLDFQVTINKVYELVSIFGPMIYAQNPVRQVTPRPNGNPIISQCQQRYLNYTPGEFGLKATSKAALDEGMIHGRGCTITGVDRRTGLVSTVGVHDKDILIDPSEDKWYNAHYILRLRRNVPLWKIAERFGAKTAQRFLKKRGDGGGMNGREGIETWFGHQEHWYGFANSAYDISVMTPEEERQVREFDGPRISYVEVYSKMGVGYRSDKGANNREVMGGAPLDERDHVVFAYEPSRKIILNQPGPWPIPYWADHGKHSWPFAFIDPAENQDKTWPISMITPALGEQKFLDWGWSFALAGIKKSVRNIGLVGSDVSDKVIAALKSNQSDVIVPVEGNAEERQNILTQLEMMQVNPSLVAMLREAEILFEKATGLYEILYGQTSRQMRSAAEANVKADFSRLRIDDVIDRVEDWHDEIARKEALGARFIVGPQQMVPIMGEQLAMAWDFFKPGDFKEAIAEYDYTVRAGSMRKRTPQYRAEIAEKALMIGGQAAMGVGDLELYNKLWLEWLEANGVPNAERFILQALPPPEAQQGGQEQEPEPPQAPEVQEIVDGQPVIATPGGAA